ncbi:MAG: rhodanese-like domain-containing protein [Epsilonproteobacteria bacterium]|nr:rhodanese-like domain-containing protein [Campylobacterota bacterium]
MNFNEKMSRYYQRCDEILLKENLKSLLKKAKQEVEEIETEDIDLKECVLIDVREEDEFSSGVIPADVVLTIPRGKIEFVANEKVLPYQDKTIVCYCLKGARGLLAAKALKDLGIEAKNLKGGIEAWVKSKRSIKNYLGEFILKE